MNVLCTICSDLVNQAENIYGTKCGHIFHHQCLAQWIERSKTCPQCRNKVTDKCMFRLYPTVSNENSGEDAATLQSRLDDAQLQLRQQRVKAKEKEDKLTVATADLKRQDDLLKSYEKRLVSFDSKVLALREQLELVNVQNKEMQKIKDENKALEKKMQTLNGLQTVLNATSPDVELMLDSYSDVRTIATFAAALKRALCDSESKNIESRNRLHVAKQQLALERKNVADMHNKIERLEGDLRNAQEKYDDLKNKNAQYAESKIVATKHHDPPQYTTDEEDNSSFNGLVHKIENSDSPYLTLKQGGGLCLAALQRAPLKLSETAPKSEKVYLNAVKNAHQKRVGEKSNAISTKHSIFNKKEPLKIETLDNIIPKAMDTSYDGLGGHSKPDVFPVPNNNVQSRIPKISAKHKLKRPNPNGSQDIGKMLKKGKNK